VVDSAYRPIGVLSLNDLAQTAYNVPSTAVAGTLAAISEHRSAPIVTQPRARS